jgi:hypothetical protein
MKNNDQYQRQIDLDLHFTAHLLSLEKTRAGLQLIRIRRGWGDFGSRGRLPSVGRNGVNKNWVRQSLPAIQRHQAPSSDVSRWFVIRI